MKSINTINSARQVYPTIQTEEDGNESRLLKFEPDLAANPYEEDIDYFDMKKQVDRKDYDK